jgi:hypothetical protein
MKLNNNKEPKKLAKKDKFPKDALILREEAVTSILSGLSEAYRLATESKSTEVPDYLLKSDGTKVLCVLFSGLIPSKMGELGNLGLQIEDEIVLKSCSYTNLEEGKISFFFVDNTNDFLSITRTGSFCVVCLNIGKIIIMFTEELFGRFKFLKRFVEVIITWSKWQTNIFDREVIVYVGIRKYSASMSSIDS